MTVSERWGFFSDVPEPLAGGEDPWGKWLRIVVVGLFVLLLISLFALLPERP